MKKCQANEFSKTTNYRLLACSKRSDSGERCEVKKAMKVEGGLGREVLLLPRFYFFALLFTSHRSPLSERLEKANRLQVCPSVPPTVFPVLFILFLLCFDRLFLVFAQFGSGFGLNFCNVRDAALLGVVSLDKRLFTLPLGV